MIKKLLLIIISTLLLCGCNAYQKLGYNSDTAKLISNLKEENQAFFSEYDPFLEKLINIEDFNEDNIEEYKVFEGIIEEEDIVKYVNEGIIKENNKERLIKLLEVEDFNEDNLKEYLKYYPRVSEELLVKLVNDKRMNDYSKIALLAKDSFFIYDNLDSYLEHYDEKEDIRLLIEYINSKAYLPPYTDEEKADVDKYGYQVLVNKYYKLAEDYEPEDLVQVEAHYGVGKLRQEAYEAYKKMQDAAQEEGISMYITSPYRSYNTQYVLYNRYLGQDPVEVVDTYSARPGNSEHQLGLAVDILTQGYDFGTFYSAPAAKWLEENAHKYGFIFRYPNDKIDITGYKYEPWHYRYVGDIATDVYESGVTYDEYFEMYIK